MNGFGSHTYSVINANGGFFGSVWRTMTFGARSRPSLPLLASPIELERSFCHRIELSYVSWNPFRVPVARLAAQAALEEAP
jgi:hypothetical protein